jgi:hypothetical protein
VRERRREQFSRRCARSRQVKGVLHTLKHGQNRTSCVFDKRYAEQQCHRYSRQRRKFAPPGAAQKKETIYEFSTKGYPPNLRAVGQPASQSVSKLETMPFAAVPQRGSRLRCCGQVWQKRARAPLGLCGGMCQPSTHPVSWEMVQRR